MQVNFHLLPTTEHSNGWKEASRRHNSILLPYDLAIPGEENLVVETEEKVDAGLSPGDTQAQSPTLGVIWGDMGSNHKRAG